VALELQRPGRRFVMWERPRVVGLRV